MSRWIRINADILNDWLAQTLPPKAFKAAVLAAARGEESPLSDFIQPHHGRPPAQEWADLRTMVFERDDYTCRYCGERGKRLECDHVFPVARGGDSTPDNLAAACIQCNRSKRDKTVEEWFASGHG